MGKACRLLGLTVLYSVLTVIAHGFIAPRPTPSAPIATRVMATSSPFTSLPEGISSYSTSRLGDDVGFLQTLTTNIVTPSLRLL